MNLSVNGYEYNNLSIISYAIKIETLDGEGTARSMAHGWPMIRDPQGTIQNLSIEFGGQGDLNNSNNPDFNHLWRTCKAMGTEQFAAVKFVDPTGSVIEQNMYLVASELKYKRITIDDVVYTHALRVDFVAERGI